MSNTESRWNVKTRRVENALKLVKYLGKINLIEKSTTIVSEKRKITERKKLLGI